MEHKKGLHHITVLAGDPQRNADFYINKLGLRLVKKSVNQDDPGTYHLFYGNQTASPGSSLTFFPWPRSAQGTPGTGEAVTVSYSVHSDALPYWPEHLSEQEISFKGPFDRFGLPVIQFNDPDGLQLELIFDQTVSNPNVETKTKSSIPADHAIHGFWGVRLKLSDPGETISILEELFGFEQETSQGNETLYQTNAPIGKSVIIENSDPVQGKNGRSTIHHVAFRTRDEEELEQLRQKVQNRGLMPTQIIDRHWFKSVYFREPQGVLFEMATDGPGYSIDEEPEHLGEMLVLPPWLETRREIIEKQLPELNIK